MKHYLKYSAAILTGLTILSLAGCNYNSNKSGMHWFLDMHDSHAVEAQEEDTTTLLQVKGEGWDKGADSVPAFSGPGSSMRVPPEGSVPRNYIPYSYEATDFEKAGRELTNPLKKTKAVLERGKKQFEIYCAVCHGMTGKGDGNVTPMFPNPPSLINGPASSQWSDGMYFHMITMGRARMKSYAAQVKPADRWAIIHYVRLLQATEK